MRFASYHTALSMPATLSMRYVASPPRSRRPLLRQPAASDSTMETCLEASHGVLVVGKRLEYESTR